MTNEGARHHRNMDARHRAVTRARGEVRYLEAKASQEPDPFTFERLTMARKALAHAEHMLRQSRSLSFTQ